MIKEPVSFFDEPSMYSSRDRYELIKFKVMNRVAAIQPYLVGKYVLSIGCGSGFCENLWKDVANFIVAVDIDKNSIDYAKKRYEKDGKVMFSNYSAIEIDPRGYLFDEKQFDVVVATEFIEHLKREDCEIVVDSIERLLKDGGLFIGTTPNNISGVKDPDHIYEYTYPELKSLLESKFSDVEIDQLIVVAPSWFFKCWKKMEEKDG